MPTVGFYSGNEVRIPLAYINYPPRWETCCKYIVVAGPKNLGFAKDVADVNRFAARYRAAKAFRQVQFDGITADTADGYSALCQMLLTYSAFEHFTFCLGIRKYATLDLLTKSQRDAVQAKLRTLKGQRELFRFVRDLVDRPHQEELDKHLSGYDCNPFRLASAIRHSFAHGVLTANPVKAPPRSVATVSRYLCRVLIAAIDRRFESLMIEFEAHL